MESTHPFLTAWSDLCWGKNESVGTGISQLESVSQVWVESSLGMISTTTAGNVQEIDDVSGCKGQSKVATDGGSNLVANSHVPVVIRYASSVGAIGDQNQLTVAVKGDIGDHVIGNGAQKVDKSGNFWLRCGPDSHVSIRAGVGA